LAHTVFLEKTESRLSRYVKY